MEGIVNGRNQNVKPLVYVGGRAINLLDAVKSGRRFRRRHNQQHDVAPAGWLGSDRVFVVSHDDVLATDWELEPAPVTVTREQFLAAWRDTEQYCEGMAKRLVIPSALNWRDELMKRLGLE